MPFGAGFLICYPITLNFQKKVIKILVMSIEFGGNYTESGFKVEDGSRAVREVELILGENKKKQGIFYTFKDKISEWGTTNIVVAATIAVAAEYLVFGNYFPNTLRLLSEGRNEEAVGSMFMGGITLVILGTVFWASAVKKIL
ncbi:MAG: hypothetical protein C4584_01875 [Armatimonadetes bacterium]|nr:MAG: hypothetical protein C4584_01875 [Armatimonadota bacterium]